MCRDLWINTVIQLASRGINVRAGETLITCAAHYRFTAAASTAKFTVTSVAAGRKASKRTNYIFIHFIFIFSSDPYRFFYNMAVFKLYTKYCKYDGFKTHTTESMFSYVSFLITEKSAPSCIHIYCFYRKKLDVYIFIKSS